MSDLSSGSASASPLADGLDGRFGAGPAGDSPAGFAGMRHNPLARPERRRTAAAAQDIEGRDLAHLDVRRGRDGARARRGLPPAAAGAGWNAAAVEGCGNGGRFRTRELAYRTASARRRSAIPAVAGRRGADRARVLHRTAAFDGHPGADDRHAGDVDAQVLREAAMRRQDYFRQGSRGWLRLHEKGGKRHDVLAHHRAAEALDDHLEAAGLDEAKAPLLQSVDPSGWQLTGRALSRRLVLAMIKRRAAAADLPASTCCHTFRATGTTAYLSNGGTLEHAQQIAGHASPKTTKLYDRTADTITLDEIERIVI